MPSPSDSRALVASSTGGSSFAQQGSLDWVALGNTTHTATIAVLARLAGAGVDNLTVAFGQAMCSKLPIGSHGEKVLAEAMNGLKAKSFAEDLLWIGVGVRHILRDLVRTSQGCSLVALCGALTEGYSKTVGALIMYELAKNSGGPQEITPSYEQWKTLLHVAAPVFTSTTFGVRVWQITRTVMPDSWFVNTGNRPEDPHPTDVAKVLLSIGQIVEGSLHSISIQGGFRCSWIAVWADVVLGLRTLVRDAQGTVVYASFDVRTRLPQVSIDLTAVEHGESALCIQSSHVIRSGYEFIGECIHPILFPHSAFPGDFSTGRLKWETLFTDLFGAHFAVLLKAEEDTDSQSPWAAQDTVVSTNETEPANKTFIRFLALSTILTVLARADGDSILTNAIQYFNQASYQFSELRQCSEQVHFEIERLVAMHGPEDCLLDWRRPTPGGADTGAAWLLDEFFCCIDSFGELCTCLQHHSTKDDFLDKSNVFCLSRTAVFIRQMILFTDRIIFDTPLQPSVGGMYSLYHDLVTDHNEVKSSARLWEMDSPTMFQNLYYSKYGPKESVYRIFSVEYKEGGVGMTVAYSDGKIYCYNHLLAGLTDNIIEARKIHVGSGHIQYLSRLPDHLFDDSASYVPVGYPPLQVEEVNSMNDFKLDTTSNPIHAQLIINEMPTRLSLTHRVTTLSGEMLIPPIYLLRKLEAANRYKSMIRWPGEEPERWKSVFQNLTFDLAHGEGDLCDPQVRHILRTHRGNRLGRCVAISRVRHSIALIKTDEELSVFCRSWAYHCAEKKKIGKEPDYYVLVS